MQSENPAAKNNDARLSTSLGEGPESLERRRLIASLVGAVPLVLTVTAGTARAQTGSTSPISEPEEQSEEEQSQQSEQDPLSDEENLLDPEGEPGAADDFQEIDAPSPLLDDFSATEL